MKKILLFATPVIAFAFLSGCSEDHNSPTFGQYKDLPVPTDVVATYNANTDMVDVLWGMNDEYVVDGDTLIVTNHLVAWSDSSLFESGNIGEQYVNEDVDGTPVKNMSLTAEHVLRSMKYYTSADIDSFIVYFRVSAVFNSNNFVSFVGPPAEVDSALIKR